MTSTFPLEAIYNLICRCPAIKKKQFKKRIKPFYQRKALICIKSTKNEYFGSMYGKNIICIVRSDYIKNGYRCVTYLTKESIKDVCTTHTEKTVCVCMYLRVSIYHPWGCIIL